MSELETQAAEAVEAVDTCLADPCVVPNCPGYYLRWPGLSRECPKCHRAGSHQGDCYACHGSGRVPGVTLEKVLALLIAADGVVSFQGVGTKVIESYCAWTGYPEEPPDKVHHGDTPLEAALAALLSSKTPASLAQTELAPE